MSKTTIAFTLLLAVVVVTAIFTATKTFALWTGDQPISTTIPFEREGIPKEVVAAINKAKRVREVQRQASTSLCFEGDTTELNEFLAAMAKMKNADNPILTVTLIPEPGKSEEAVGHPAGPEEFHYNWALDFIYCPIFENGRQTGMGIYRVDVAVHVVGKIEVEKLAIPIAFEASVGGRISELVEQHKQRREDTIASTQPDTRPTIYEAKSGASVFGSATEPSGKTSEELKQLLDMMGSSTQPARNPS
jgi:hypothetical protein